MILRNQVPGFLVEGRELPTDHPHHPQNKSGLLLKSVKAFQETGTVKMHKMVKKKRSINGVNSITISSDIVTTPGKP